MNVGFSNLFLLKSYLLSEALTSATDFDDAITSIGLGVYGAFERICNRKFMYEAGRQEVTQGDRDHWYCMAKPITQFTNVELRYFLADPWTSIAGQPLAADFEKGLIHFGYNLGVRPIQVRITYNGGYFWNTLEPTDEGYPQTVPNDITNNAAQLNPNAFNLPPDLYFAWRTQCEILWKMRDKLGKNIASEESKGRGPMYEINDEELSPFVLRVVRQYTRYQLT